MSDAQLTITTFSHNFSVTRLAPRAKAACIEFAKKYAQWGWENNRGHMQRVMKTIYGTATNDREEFRFHINQLPEFRIHLEQYSLKGDHLIEEVTAPAPKSVDVEIKIKAVKEERDYQNQILEYFDAPLPVSKMVDLQTGKGKGYTTMKGMSNIGKRTVIMVKASFMEKWFDELRDICDLEIDDILMVKGGDNLMALLELAKWNQLDCKIIIISLETYQTWLTAYKEFHDETLHMGYACLPWQFFEFVGAGLRVIDEVHLKFHLNFKIDLYTHVEKSIALSATLMNYDPFLVRMYELAYPKKDRWAGLALDKYMDAYPVYYRFANPNKIKTQEFGGRGYSHNALEKSVLKSPQVLDNYFRLIEYMLEIGFFCHPRPQKSCLIFCSSVDMCTTLMNHLKDKYPTRDIRRYVGSLKDPFPGLINGEIVVTTIGSAGTAIDKPHLTNVVLTQAVNSLQANVQTFGRLRKIGAGDENQTQFHYAVCTDIPKHMDYDHAKQQVLKDRARNVKSIYSGIVV